MFEGFFARGYRMMSYSLKKRLVMFCLIIASCFAVKIAFLDVGFASKCPFCDTNVLRKQVFYQDDFVMGLCDYKPIYPGHCLVIPKRHVTRFEELSNDEVLSTAHVIKKINKVIQKKFGPCIYIILQKNGKGVQSVPHVHFHYIPKKDMDSVFAGIWYLWRFFIALFKSPMSDKELASCVAMMKQEIINVV
jgi:diadenosine tetraphosphate (Ap4A) HIT family hydrolase